MWIKIIVKHLNQNEVYGVLYEESNQLIFLGNFDSTIGLDNQISVLESANNIIIPQHARFLKMLKMPAQRWGLGDGHCTICHTHMT